MTIVNHERDVLDPGLTRDDELLPNGLDLNVLAEIRTAIEDIGGIRELYIARKRTDDAPFYVLGVLRESHWWRLEPRDADARLLRRIANEVPLRGEFVVLSIAKPNRWLGRRLKQVDAATVHRS